MSSSSDFRRVGDQVRNWGRWGPDDQLGTLNFIDTSKIVEASRCVVDGVSISLGIDLGPNGPQGGPAAKVSPFRSNPHHFMVLDGGDADLPLGTEHIADNRIASAVARGRHDNLFRFNEDYVVMPLQAGTQWDSLAHVYYDRQLYNGYSADTVSSFGASRNSIDVVGRSGGVVSRGVLIDVAGSRGVSYIDGGEPIEPEELDAILQATGVSLGRGDIALVRTGWTAAFRERADGDYLGNGLSWRCAQWLSELELAAVASDNKAVEASHVRSVPDTSLPLHLLAQRDMGMMFGELFDLERLASECARDGRYDFMLSAPALRFVGAVATPLNPVALR